MTFISRFGRRPPLLETPLTLMIWLLIATATAVPSSPFQATPDARGGAVLKGLTLDELGDIEVTTVSREPQQVWKTPAATYVLTKQDIIRSGATTIPEALRLVPGVEVARTDADTWAVGIRGFGSQFSKSMLVLIDGRSVYTPLFAGVNWRLQNVMLEDVVRIEVVRGPGGAILGTNAVNGVVNIITENSRNTPGAFDSPGGGNLERGDFTMRYGSALGKNGSYRVYGMAFHDGPELHPDRNNFDDWELRQGGFRLDWDNHKKDAISLQGDLYRGSIGESEDISYLSPPRSAVVNTPESVSGRNLLFKWQRKFNENSDFQFQAYYDRTWRLGSQSGEKRNTFDLDFIHHLNLLPRQEFTWGVGARWSPSDFIQTVPAVVFQPNHQADNIYSAFLQDTITILQDSVWLTLGSKFEHNIYTGWETQPDACILWTPSSRQSVWAAVIRAVRSPSRLDEDLQLTNLYATNPVPVFLRLVGNRQFVSEKLLGYELGYRRLLTSKIFFDLALFRNKYNDLTSYGSPALGSETFSDPPGLVAVIPWTNGISGTTEGFEIAPDRKPVPWLETRGSWSYLNMQLKSKIGDPAACTINADDGSSPRHTLSFRARISLPKRFEFDSVLRYVSALPAQYPAGLPADYVNAYGAMDFRLARQMNRSLEVSISGRNLLQASHSDFAGDPGALVLIGRTFYVALAWRERDTP